MRAVRQPFDAVLCGAGTLRADRADSTVGPEREQRRVAQGLPPRPLAVVLSTTGDLPYDRSDFAQRQPYRISLVGSGTPADRREKLTAWGQLFVAPTKRPTAQWVLQTLQEECGVRRLLVEGGPAINGLFLEAGMIDEICWTLAPKLIGSGEDLTMITHGVLPHPQRLTLRTAYLHEDEFFFRHAVMHDQA
jgi:5-amino-6-(5-phosphoribosylamino)uracil reductase